MYPVVVGVVVIPLLNLEQKFDQSPVKEQGVRKSEGVRQGVREEELFLKIQAQVDKGENENQKDRVHHLPTSCPTFECLTRSSVLMIT